MTKKWCKGGTYNKKGHKMNFFQMIFKGIGWNYYMHCSFRTSPDIIEKLLVLVKEKQLGSDKSQGKVREF